MKLSIANLSMVISYSIIPKTYSQHTHAEWSKHIIANEQSAINNILFDGESVIKNGYWFLAAEYEGIELPYYTSSNALIVKSDLNGNIIWHSTMVGEGYETFFDMALDSENNIVAVGWSSSNDTIKINGEVVYVPDMEGTSRGIVAKFSGINGSLIWYKPILPYQEYYNISITNVTIDTDDNIYISGYSNSSFSIDNIEYLFTQTGWGAQTFVAKLDSQGAVVSVHGIPVTSVSLCPNPASSIVSLIMGSEIEEITITDPSGRIVNKQRVGAKSIQIDISGLTNGLYLVHLATQNEITT